MEVADYSDKAIVVRGELTKEFKEDLKELGGKYNANLKGGAGWIYSKKNEAKVKEFVNKNTRGVPKEVVPKVVPKVVRIVPKTVLGTPQGTPQGLTKNNILTFITSYLSSVSDLEKLRFIQAVIDASKSSKVILASSPKKDDEDQDEELSDSEEAEDEEDSEEEEPLTPLLMKRKN